MLDLLAQATDLVVGDVRHFFEGHFFGRRSSASSRTRTACEGSTRMWSPALRRSLRRGSERVTTRSSSVWPSTTARPSPNSSTIAMISPRPGEARTLDDIERLVQNDELPLGKVRGVDVRVNVDAHVLAVDHDLGGAVLVRALVDAVAVRRRAELVDLFLQELHLLLGFLKRRHQLLVLSLRIRELVARQVDSDGASRRIRRERGRGGGGTRRSHRRRSAALREGLRFRREEIVPWSVRAPSSVYPSLIARAPEVRSCVARIVTLLISPSGRFVA